MILSLAENIRSLRKQRKMTQEKLAEALGVTVGAVYKWESGQSQPELSLLVELADFFDTSVDALLGYRFRDNSLNAGLERIAGLCQTMDPSALAETEKILGKYPHSFRAVYNSAAVYMTFGASSRNPRQLHRVQELLERARVLLPQNEDPHISEATIRGNQAMVSFLLGEKEKSVELLKRNNAGGMFSAIIGVMTAIYGSKVEEAVPFLTETLITCMSDLLSFILGEVFLFRARNDWASAMAVLNWGIDVLTGLQTPDMPGALGKTHAELLMLLSCAQAQLGLAEASADSLKAARRIALRFDATPDYGLQSMRFVESTEPSIAVDFFGVSAEDSIVQLIRLLEDQRLAEAWEELKKNEP